MARMRTIKPEFWTDRRVIAVTPFARLLFIGTWNFACDAGHLLDDATELRLKVLPADLVEVEPLLEELIEVGCLERRQTASGRDYLLIPKLTSHQKVDPRWASRCPVCTELRGSDGDGTSPNLPETPVSLDETHRDSPKLSQTPPTSAGIGKDGLGKESKKTPRPSAPRVDLDTDPDFVAFWESFPRREGKGDARKAWPKALTKASAAHLVAAAKAYAVTVAGTETRFIKTPGAWLNAERFNDEAPNVNGHRPGWTPQNAWMFGEA